VDVVFTFNNSDLISKLLRRGKILKYGTNGSELEKIDQDIKQYICQNFENLRIPQRAFIIFEEGEAYEVALSLIKKSSWFGT
jgi:hypothetical protein